MSLSLHLLDDRAMSFVQGDGQPCSCEAAAAAYLAGRDELQGAQGGAHVLNVVLELIESSGNAGLNLRGVLARRRVGSDLVEVRHGGRYSCRRLRERGQKLLDGARRLLQKEDSGDIFPFALSLCVELSRIFAELVVSVEACWTATNSLPPGLPS
jgi:hypothetical protein